MKIRDVHKILWSLVLVGCASSETSNQYVRRDDGKPLVDEKYSLTADRDRLSEYRSEVPTKRQIENDELAYIIKFFENPNRAPSDIRSDFDNKLRKKRDLLSKDLQKEREAFTKAERKQRDEFLKLQKSERDSFISRKPTKEARDDFFKTQEDRRKEHFSNERERRDDFESDVRERRKNFEDYARDRQNEFNQEIRIYQKKFDQMKKDKEEARKARQSEPRSQSPAVDAPKNTEAELFLQELQEAHQKAGAPLESGQ